MTEGQKNKRREYERNRYRNLSEEKKNRKCQKQNDKSMLVNI